MKQLLSLSLCLPLCSFILLSLLSFYKTSLENTERRTYKLLMLLFSLSLINNLFLSFYFFAQNNTEFHFELFRLLIDKKYHFYVTIYFDIFGAGYLLCASIITNLIVYYSQRYLHNDPGYQRFFIIISLFYFGLNLVILSGGLNTIFAGWEVMGLSSFLLISYFWHRPKAAIQAQVAYNIYRITDIGLLGSVLISHFLWHGSHLFVEINQAHDAIKEIPIYWRWLLSLCILLPVLGKSAQFPLSFWLPKAMEGPTHSSAIFYGSLSIHAGVFLLIRTYPIWDSTPYMKLLIFLIGLITALMATLCAQVQANIKGQIGYASIAQVGLMLILLSLGFVKIAFLHMLLNAFLRTFQLLVSGSIITTHLENQGKIKNFSKPRKFSWPKLFSKKIQANLFVLAINEGYLDTIFKIYIVFPVLNLSQKLNNLFSLKSIKTYQKKAENITLNAQTVPTILFILATFWAMFLKVVLALKLIFLLIAGLFSFLSLGEKESAKKTVIFASLSYFFCFFSSIVLNWSTSHAGLVYLFGFFGSVIFTLEIINYLIKKKNILFIDQFNGLYQQFPYLSGLMLLGILGIIGFPLCVTFIGEEILLNFNKNHNIFFMLIFYLIFIINGIALMRLYSYLFFGRRDNFIESVNLDFTPKKAFVRLLIFFSVNVLSYFMIYV